MRCRPAPGSRDSAPARLPGQRPRPASPSWLPPSAHRHLGRGRRRGTCRCLLDDRDRRMGRRGSQPVRAALGARRDAPGHYSVPTETTIRRTLGCLDPQALATAIGAWLCDRDRPSRSGSGGGQSRSMADAARRQTQRPPGPPAGRDRPRHPRRAGPTPGRRRARGGARLRPAAGTPGPGAGVVVTADALQTHPEAAEFLVCEQHAHYLLVVKANQALLLVALLTPALAPRPGAGPQPRPWPRPG